MTTDWRSEFLDAYRRHRVDDQARYYGDRTVEFERARRGTVAATAALLVVAALAGALGAAYGHQRAMWAFLAAALSAVASAITVFESAFGFERFSRRAAETAAALVLADTKGPRAGTPITDEELLAYVVDIEKLLRSELDTWSQLVVKTGDLGDATSK